MEKIRKIINENIKLIIGIILGLIVSNVVVYAANTANINSKDVAYTNTTSGLTSTNVQSAIDEVNTKANNTLRQIIAYTYNQTEGASNYCVTGNESTCNKTECYKTKTVNSCMPGTIIDYLVNYNTRVRFHVLHDDGDTITMQSQKNTIYNIKWSSNGGGADGPSIVLPELEDKTSNWTNVNQLIYSIGNEEENSLTKYTLCNSFNLCTESKYSYTSRTARARMITVQEAADSNIGCTNDYSSCPIWMYNYLSQSTSYGGTEDDVYTENGASSNMGYWTMNPSSSHFVSYSMNYHGNITTGGGNSFGARAVVEISK